MRANLIQLTAASMHILRGTTVGGLASAAMVSLLLAGGGGGGSACALGSAAGCGGTLDGPPMLARGSSATLTLTVRDAAGQPVAGAPYTASAAHGNAITPGAPAQTNSRGRATLVLQASKPGTETITVRAAGASASHAVAIGAAFTLSPAVTVDAAGAEVLPVVNTGACQPVDAHYTGPANAGATVLLTTSRGRVFADSACRQPLGTPLPLTGGDMRRAYLADSGQQEQRSKLLAIVRDGTAANNLVKNAVVTFSIVADASGGMLAPPSTATTGADGTATATYVAGGGNSGHDGVTIVASIAGLSGAHASASTRLTVSRQAMSIQFGTGNRASRIKDAPLDITVKPAHCHAVMV